jgi:hypothetical protein
VVQPIDRNDVRNAFNKEAPTQFETKTMTNQPKPVDSGRQVASAGGKQRFKERPEGPKDAMGRASQIVPELALEDSPLLKKEEDHLKEIMFKLSTKYPLVHIAQFLPGMASLTDLTPPRDIRTFIRNFDAWEYRLAIGGIPRRGYHLPTLPL